MDGPDDAMAAAPPRSLRRTLDEAAAPARASQPGEVPEGSADAAAKWFEALDLKTFFGDPAEVDPKCLNVFEKVRAAVVDLDRRASRQADHARKAATALNSHTEILRTVGIHVTSLGLRSDQFAQDVAAAGALAHTVQDHEGRLNTAEDTIKTSQKVVEKVLGDAGSMLDKVLSQGLIEHAELRNVVGQLVVAHMTNA